jgi:phosphoglycerate dehydrogenase-like enzyme
MTSPPPLKSIVILDAIEPATAERMRSLLPPGFSLSYATQRGTEHLKAIIADAEYAVSGQVAVDGEVLRAGTRLKLLHKWGVGVDNFDLDAAKTCGIQVARTTGSNALAVAEFTLGLMISTLRHAAHGHHSLQSGEWRGFRGRSPFLLSNKTVGLVGFGAIGRKVAELLRPFNCTIVYNKPNRLEPEDESLLGVSYVNFQTLLERCDVISLHCPYTEHTAGLFNEDALRSMRSTAVLINMARGGIVVEDDLAWALRNDIIQAAAADVFETEPLPPGNALQGLDNMTLTPHLGAMCADTFEPNVQRMFYNIECVSRGEPVPELDRVLG